MMSHVNACSLTAYHILWAEFGELPIKSYAFHLSSSCFSPKICPPTIFLVSQLNNITFSTLQALNNCQNK
jgi:hypothetical protein